MGCTSSVPKEHKFYVHSCPKFPTTPTGILAGVLSDPRAPNPFFNVRTWPSGGTLPSFKDLGAIKSDALGVSVIYPDKAYKKAVRLADKYNQRVACLQHELRKYDYPRRPCDFYDRIEMVKALP